MILLEKQASSSCNVYIASGREAEMNMTSYSISSRHKYNINTHNTTKGLIQMDHKKIRGKNFQLKILYKQHKNIS